MASTATAAPPASISPPRRTLGGGPDWEAAIHESDTMRIATQIGEPIMIAATGNNLRDLFLVARD